MKTHSRFKIWFTVLLSSIIILTLCSPVSALNDSWWSMFNANGIYYWYPDGTMSCVIGTGSYDGAPSAGLSAEQAGFVDTYHDIAEQLSVEYGIPWEAVIGQGINESAAGTSHYARERNNFFGIGAVDSNPDKAYYYNSPEEGWRGYFEFITNNSRYRNNGVFQNGFTNRQYAIKPSRHNRLTRDNITNPYDYLQTIWDAGYATSESYYNNIEPLITAIINRAQEKGWKTSLELSVMYPEMFANAAVHAADELPAASSPVSYTGTICISPGIGVDSGNGDINSTAIALSWPDDTHSIMDPKPEYQAALNFTGISKIDDEFVQIGASCDAFVATVMRFSGVDPDFPCCSAAKLNAYLEAHPEKYQKIGNAGTLNTEDMRPGDIRSGINTNPTPDINGHTSSGHIEIFVQLPDGSYAIADASYGKRTATHYKSFYKIADYDVYRKI